MLIDNAKHTTHFQRDTFDYPCQDLKPISPNRLKKEIAALSQCAILHAAVLTPLQWSSVAFGVRQFGAQIGLFSIFNVPDIAQNLTSLQNLKQKTGEENLQRKEKSSESQSHCFPPSSWRLDLYSPLDRPRFNSRFKTHTGFELYQLDIENTLMFKISPNSRRGRGHNKIFQN